MSLTTHTVTQRMIQGFLSYIYKQRDVLHIQAVGSIIIDLGPIKKSRALKTFFRVL